MFPPRVWRCGYGRPGGDGTALPLLYPATVTLAWLFVSAARNGPWRDPLPLRTSRQRDRRRSRAGRPKVAQTRGQLAGPTMSVRRRPSYHPFGDSEDRQSLTLVSRGHYRFSLRRLGVWAWFVTSSARVGQCRWFGRRCAWRRGTLCPAACTAAIVKVGSHLDESRCVRPGGGLSASAWAT